MTPAERKANGKIEDAENYGVDPVSGYSWPTTLDAINAVRVQFVVGDGSSADVKQAILLMVEDWYENRADSSAESLTTINRGSTALLNLHRQMFV